LIQAKLELAFTRMTSGIFNLGSGTVSSFKELADIIASKENDKIELIPFPPQYKDAYQYWTCADLKKLREAGIVTSFRTIRQYFNI
jgi:ADP-L-glycero-D-manno-heptose 6-epimerase